MINKRPLDHAYKPQRLSYLLVYGLRMTYQLWPIWCLWPLAGFFQNFWAPFLSASSGSMHNVFVWLTPFIHLGFAAALISFCLLLKKLGLAAWNTVDAATTGFLALLVYKIFIYSQLTTPISGLQTSALAALLVALLLIVITQRSRHLLNDLFHFDAGAAEVAPKIKGKIIAPPAAGLRDIDPAKLAAQLDKRVIGQNRISEYTAKAVARRLAQQRRNKPVFTALFAGPTGVGKTEMAKALAEALLGQEKSLFRVDCGNVLGEAGLQTLIGAPTGYMGSDKPGALTAHVQAFPQSILLFDEIEKAATQQGTQSPLFRLLLSLLDEGRFTEQSTGQTIDATGCLILMTSNAAHRTLATIYNEYQNDSAALTRATKDALQNTFAPEFLARIDLVTCFSPLDTEARAKVIAMHCSRIAGQYGVRITSIDASLINEGLKQWQALEAYGAREMLRWLEDQIADPIMFAKKQGLTAIMLSRDDATGMAKATKPD